MMSILKTVWSGPFPAVFFLSAAVTLWATTEHRFYSVKEGMDLTTVIEMVGEPDIRAMSIPQGFDASATYTWRENGLFLCVEVKNKRVKRISIFNLNAF
jgi:hypothetical protein